jgi:hypothetical protein
VVFSLRKGTLPEFQRSTCKSEMLCLRPVAAVVPSTRRAGGMGSALPALFF